MNKAVFLDRDGVINDGTLYYTFKIDDFKINEGVYVGLKLLQTSGFKLIIITNQSGIAKGLFSLKDLEELHQYMKMQLNKNEINLDGIYFCPHHPDISACECRKPNNLMIETAIQDYSISRNDSYLIGDSSRDIEAAEKSRIKGIKINKNENILPWCERIVKGLI